jgi:hypothetical protein
MCDDKTGRPRTIINIEGASKLTVKEGPNGPAFTDFRGMSNAPTATKGHCADKPQRRQGKRGCMKDFDGLRFGAAI